MSGTPQSSLVPSSLLFRACQEGCHHAYPPALDEHCLCGMMQAARSGSVQFCKYQSEGEPDLAGRIR